MMRNYAARYSKGWHKWRRGRFAMYCRNHSLGGRY